MNRFLDTIETDQGVIQRDIKKIPQFQKSMDEFFEKYGVAFMAWMVYAVDSLLKEAVRNFEDDGATYEEVAFMRDILGIKGDDAARTRNGQATVLFALVSMSVIRQDVVNKMQSAMIGNTKMGDFRDAIEKSVSRKYHDFFEVNAVAVLFNIYNAANRFFAKEYNYKKFRYEGGLIKDSRDFCIARDGLEFFEEEGERWNEMEWAGKMPGVDFFVQIGGFGCRHWLVYLKD